MPTSREMPQTLCGAAHGGPDHGSVVAIIASLVAIVTRS